MCKVGFFIFFLVIGSLSLSAQDTMSYQRYLTRMKLPKQVVITDVFGKPYKKIKTRKKWNEQYFLFGSLVTVDTVINLDIIAKGSGVLNENAATIFSYVITHNISPVHEGTSTSTISIIVNNAGAVEKVFVLENTMRYCHGEWNLENWNLKLVPVYSKKTNNYTEYILKISEDTSLDCFTDPDSKSGGTR